MACGGQRGSCESAETVTGKDERRLRNAFQCLTFFDADVARRCFPPHVTCSHPTLPAPRPAMAQRSSSRWKRKATDQAGGKDKFKVSVPDL